ncbi:hypothetical protein LJR013_003188 [Pseudarthrobacter oxydans]|uniref:hypothetical protein n=1 Tax=Pseudarthrobacter oxydans TaxID=1671 RepID=UPI003ECC68D7
MAQIPGGGVSVRYGVARWDGEQWLIEDNGNLLSAMWLDPIQPLQGGQIAYLLVTDDYGQSSALVLGGYTKQPRPSTGSILAVGVVDIVVAGEDGVTYTTSRYLGAAADYTVGDDVYITWDAAQPTILGQVSEITVTPDAPISQPTQPTRGTAHLIATASDTYNHNGWGAWAGSTGGREKVYSGTQSGTTVTGSWFYGPWGTSLAGLTIHEVRFRIPARLPGVGTSGPVTIHLYAHTSQSRPGGDVTRVAGPFAVNLPAGYDPNVHTLNPALPPGWVVLPADFHAAFPQGGGVSISGGGYVGLNGRLDDAQSGQTDIDWSTT